MPTVFVVSPVAMFREGIASYLEGCPGFEVVGVSGTLTGEARAADVCVVDRADLETERAGPFCSNMRRSGTNVVVIGVRREGGDVLVWLEAGAAGYVTRDESLADLHEAILETLRYGARVEPDDVALLLQRLRNPPVPSGGEDHGPAAALTHREQEVADLVCQSLSNQEIASVLGISIHTTKHHVRSTMAKLGVDRRGRVPAALAGIEAAE
ncbi:response regulator transcription factor [Georgenia sp. 311]|uniref:Response regulator transcription factor n=2 Tax=Georgenia wutianyii TaxID=2585135 RepID=A0ABX5VLN2_9MICO|nr:response regulator transcription factor [Georgenia sp. 311]QDB79382.1 response regulator transcription factor [Georgenia wutianyii]